MSDGVTAAVRGALATYLQSDLATSFPDLVVSPAWPDPAQALPPRAITVVTPTAPETVYHAPVVHRVTPGTAPRGTVMYSYGTVTLGLQLDVWATFPSARDELAAAVEPLLNRSPLQTLPQPPDPAPTGIAAMPRLGHSSGLVLLVDALNGTLCDFDFEALPLPIDAGDAAQSGEWRASWTGSAFFYLTSQEQVTLIQRLLFDFGDGEIRIVT